MLRTLLLAIAIGVCAQAGLSTRAASAFPTGDSLIVTVYYKDATRTKIVGETWRGCGTPPGSWGTTSTWFNVRFTPCTPPQLDQRDAGSTSAGP